LHKFDVSFDVAVELAELFVGVDLIVGDLALAQDVLALLPDCSRNRVRRCALRGLSGARGAGARQR